MHGARLRVIALAACCTLLLSSAQAHAQEVQRGRWSTLRTAGEGTLAGLGLGFALVNPSPEDWPVADPAAVTAAVAAGVVAAFATRGASRGLDPASTRRPRLRMAVGAGAGPDWDYSLAYRAPLGGRWDLEGAIQAGSEEWQRIVTETRCNSFFGCITGDFLVDHRYRQSIAAALRGAYHLRAGDRASTVLTLGAGPMISHHEAEGHPATRHTSLGLDAGVGVDVGRRSRWTVEVQARTAVPGVSRTCSMR